MGVVVLSCDFTAMTLKCSDKICFHNNAIYLRHFYGNKWWIERASSAGNQFCARTWQTFSVTSCKSFQKLLQTCLYFGFEFDWLPSSFWLSFYGVFILLLFFITSSFYPHSFIIFFILFYWFTCMALCNLFLKLFCSIMENKWNNVNLVITFSCNPLNCILFKTFFLYIQPILIKRTSCNKPNFYLELWSIKVKKDKINPCSKFTFTLHSLFFWKKETGSRLICQSDSTLDWH